MFSRHRPKDPSRSITPRKPADAGAEPSANAEAAQDFTQAARARPTGIVGRLARLSIAHRRLVVVVWVALLLAGMAATSAIGNRFDNALSLPRTDSQRAVELLEQGLPSRAGDSDQIVFATAEGKLGDASTRAVVLPMLRRVAALPHVTAVSSPYGGDRRAAAISRDGRVGFATVTFDREGAALPPDAITRLAQTAEAIRSPRLQVELNGNAIEQLNRPSAGPATAIGVAAAIVILLLSLGSFAAMGLPIATALAGLGAGSGLIAIATHQFTIPDFAQQVAMMVGLGVGVDYALLVVTRYRDTYQRNGGDIQAAIEVAMDTAGRSITFAGATVVIALAGLYAVGVNLLNGVALAASVSVGLVLASSLTLLPALLSFAGRRVAVGGRLRARRARARGTRGRAGRWVTAIQRRPALAALAATALLLTLAAPALGLRLAISDAGTDQASTTTHKAYELVSRSFGPGANGPLLVAVKTPTTEATNVLARLTTTLRHTPDVATVGTPRLSAARDIAAVTVIPSSAPQSQPTYDLVSRLRGSILPRALAGTGAQAHVGGFTAKTVDFTGRLSSKLPVFIAIVTALAALLLLVVFRSLLIPLQAAVMNLLSIGASLGVVQAIFERGWLASPLGIQRSPIEPFLPVILFAIVFGLSMDYEVFLVSRIREEYQQHRNPSLAIRNGLTSTSRVITAAAAVMIVVFASFATNGGHTMQLFGIGLASAILLDAVVIRMVLLPAVLQLLGNATWKLPRWLGKRLPRLAIEPPHPPTTTQPQPLPEPA
jgi:RND superfamily putative drug exporter